MRVRGAVLGVGVGLGLACAGGAPEPPAPAPAAPEAPADEAPDAGEDEGGKLPRLERDDDPRSPDCMLQIDDLDPLLAPKQGDAKVRLRRTANRVMERYTRADGVEVRVVRGGCVHYGETWEATLPEGRDPREHALDVLGGAALKDADAGPAALGALREAERLGERGSFPCGDATCELTVADGVVTVAYDFAI